MKPRLLLFTCVPLFLAACSSSTRRTSPGPDPVPASVPDFGAAVFSAPTTVDNPFFSLAPGTTTTYAVSSGDSTETVIVEVLASTRVVNGVECVVVRDRVFEEGLLIEDTHDWYAQDDAGVVWYMGEEVDNYEYDEDGNEIGVDHEGAWEAGLDVAGVGFDALPGHIMRASPMPGDVYHQEYYRGVAEDQAEVIALSVPITLSDGSLHSCLQVRDSSALFTGQEFKYFAAGVGFVREEDVSGPDSLELRGSFVPGPGAVPDFANAVFSDPTTIDHPLVAFPAETAITFLGVGEDERETIVIERQAATRQVASVECVVVRDHVYREGLLIEDTLDWYAQDDAGHVWYMGEEVVNYEYDDEGVLLGTNDDGSWEAGLDVAGVGSIAEPGYLIPAMPLAGSAYHQEYYVDEATDMAYVVRLDAEVELADGSSFADCVQTLDWNPLDPDGLEYKYYAEGEGLLAEEPLHEDAVLERLGAFDLSPASLPDFAAASFSTPATVDHPLLLFAPGRIWTYAAETEDGPESVVVEVLATTRMVAGIECVVVLDEAFLDGVIQESTLDWYAQDDDGNVWYMGEDVTNFEYDEDGNPSGTNSDGSWEAGLDVAGVGSIAAPGYLMRAMPDPADGSHRQEFYATEAEDVALPVSTGVDVDLDNGASYTNCLRVLEWTPLAPDSLEHKLYAPGVGLVLELGLSEEGRLELETVTGP